MGQRRQWSEGCVHRNSEDCRHLLQLHPRQQVSQLSCRWAQPEPGAAGERAGPAPPGIDPPQHFPRHTTPPHSCASRGPAPFSTLSTPEDAAGTDPTQGAEDVSAGLNFHLQEPTQMREGVQAQAHQHICWHSAPCAPQESLTLCQPPQSLASGVCPINSTFSSPQVGQQESGKSASGVCLNPGSDVSPWRMGLGVRETETETEERGGGPVWCECYPGSRPASLEPRCSGGAPPPSLLEGGRFCPWTSQVSPRKKNTAPARPAHLLGDSAGEDISVQCLRGEREG